MAEPQVKVAISEPAYDELSAIRQRMTERKGRRVTYTEVIETLIERAGEREDAGA